MWEFFFSKFYNNLKQAIYLKKKIPPAFAFISFSALRNRSAEKEDTGSVRARIEIYFFS
jgi:hypothetical protein